MFLLVSGDMGSFHEVSFPNRPEKIMTEERELISQNINSNVFYSFTMRIVYFSPCKSKYFRYLRNVITTFRDYVRQVNRLGKLELTVFPGGGGTLGISGWGCAAGTLEP